MASAPSERAATTGASSELAQVLSRDYCPGHVLCHSPPRAESIPILRGSDSYRSSASLLTGSLRTLLPMNWSTRCLHQSSDIHLIPVGTPLAQTPYGLAVQTPAHGNSIAYLRKGDLTVQRPDSLSSDYSFED